MLNFPPVGHLILVQLRYVGKHISYWDTPNFLCCPDQKSTNTSWHFPEYNRGEWSPLDLEDHSLQAILASEVMENPRCNIEISNDDAM